MKILSKSILNIHVYTSMAEDDSHPETETRRLLPEGSRHVPLSGRGGPICVLRPLHIPGWQSVAEAGPQLERETGWLMFVHLN